MSATVKSRIFRITLGILAGVVTFCFVGLALIPVILPHLTFERRTFDLSDKLSAEQKKMFKRTDITFRPEFVRSPTNDVSVRCHGRILDWQYALEADMDYSLLSREVEGAFSFSLHGTSKIHGRFAGSTKAGWSIDAVLPPTEFRDTDSLFIDLLHRAVGSSITNLTNFACSGKLGFEAHAATTNGLALPTWSVKAALTDLFTSTRESNNDFDIRGARLRVGVTGLGPHYDIVPMFPRAESVELGGFAMTNVFASIRATERSLLVTEAGADVCGGQLRLYALFLDPTRLNAGVTLFLDNIDAGLALNRLAGFRGSATGRLHGKLPIRLRQGESIALGDGYLYSVPGETGTLSVEDATPILDNLAATGVSAGDCQNLSRVLKRLSYSVLKLDLKKDENGEQALNFKLEGTASEGKTTVPVSLNLTLHGEIETLINTGLKATGRQMK